MPEANSYQELKVKGNRIPCDELVKSWNIVKPSFSFFSFAFNQQSPRCTTVHWLNWNKFKAMTEQFVFYLPSAKSSLCASVKRSISVPKKLSAPGL